MKQLEFTLSLIDKVTRPLRQVQSSVTGFAEKSRQDFRAIGAGAAGLWGVGMAIKGALGPAIEMYDTLQAQAAKGIDDKALKTVMNDANVFAMTYGRSAVEFVQSTSEINAAISGLTVDELPKVTRTANIMAAALGTTAAESAEFMGQLFGNFHSEADRLGKVQFAEQLAGKMTYMRKTFGTEMGVIKDLMEGARGVGTNYGVGLNEQLAVMGELQRTLGTEASSAYEGFMTGAQAGAKKLGMSFQDSAGKMLSMPEILIKLQAKYGANIEGNITAQQALDDAFGDSAAVVKQLWGNVGTLQRNITELGGSDGLKRTQEMASKMVKPWDRFIQILTTIRQVIGLTLIPVLYPFLNRIADMGQTFARWMQMFPNIARVIGYAALAVLSFAGAGALANVVMGISGFIIAGLKGIWWLLVAVVKSYRVAIWLTKGAVIAFNAVMRTMRAVLLAVRIAAVLTGFAINFMSWPVLLIVGLIAGLIVACWLLVKHWDSIKAAVMNTAAFKVVAEAVSWVADLFGKAWAYIADGWNSFTELLSGFSITDALGGMAEGVKALFSKVWTAVKNGAAGALNWVFEKLNKIPGVNISMIEDAKAAPALENTLSTGGQLKGIEAGGINKTLSANNKSVTDNSKRIESVTINNNGGMTPGQLMEWQELAG
ncbi:phage tail tape measure protein [Serratia rhizosphaerae]